MSSTGRRSWDICETWSKRVGTQLEPITLDEDYLPNRRQGLPEEGRAGRLSPGGCAEADCRLTTARPRGYKSHHETAEPCRQQARWDRDDSSPAITKLKSHSAGN